MATAVVSETAANVLEPAANVKESAGVPASSSPSPAGGEFSSDYDVAFQTALEYEVEVLTGDNELDNAALAYKRGQLLMSTDKGDAVSTLQYDGAILQIGALNGQIYRWDIKKGCVIQSLDVQKVSSVLVEEEEKPDGDENKTDALDGDDSKLQTDDEAKRAGAKWDGSATAPAAGGDAAATGHGTDTKTVEKYVKLDVACMDMAESNTVVGSSDGTVSLWSLDSGKCVQSWEDHTERVTAVKLVDNGANVYTVGADGYFFARSVEQELITHSFINCTCPLSSLIVQEPNLVLLGSWDGTIRQLDLRMQKLAFEISTANQSPVRCMTLHQDTLFFGHGIGGIRSVDLRTRNTIIPAFNGHTDVVNCLLVHKNHLFSGSDDQSVRIFDVVRGRCLDALSGHTDGVTCLEVSGDSLLTGSYDGTVRQYCIPDIDTAILYRKRRLEEGRRIAQELWLKQKEEAKKRKKSAKKGGKGKKAAKK